MIAKKYRLTENELRKVLNRKKPFFSFIFIANVAISSKGQKKCGILLSSKNTKGSVDRNYFRRRFYQISREYLREIPANIVFVPKKGVHFSRKDPNSLQEFESNIQFLYKKVISSPHT